MAAGQVQIRLRHRCRVAFVCSIFSSGWGGKESAADIIIADFARQEGQAGRQLGR